MTRVGLTLAMGPDLKVGSAARLARPSELARIFLAQGLTGHALKHTCGPASLAAEPLFTVRPHGRGLVSARGTVFGWSCMLLILLAFVQSVDAQARRSRQDGLSTTISSSTAGEGNMHITLFGRTFLWDNAAAQKIPPILPHVEMNYGITDYFDLTAGLNALTYVFSPGYMYARAKLTTPDNKSIRFLGFGQTVEMKKTMLEYFPSNGFRVKTEGFGPEGFMLGNEETITTWKFVTSADLEFIRVSSYLPFKFYANLGWEGEFASAINDDNALRVKAGRGKVKIPKQDFSLIPMALGLELKTYTTDFFTELEAQPFTSQVMKQIRSDALGESGGEWKRFQVVGKTFDVHFMEMPIYVNSGAKLKYKNGLELQGGLSWLLSSDRGPVLGPCDAIKNVCKEGATDGYSPFYPQWKVFWLMRYAFWFTQPSSELYRSFLLKRYQDKRKKVNLDETLGAPAVKAEELDASERRRRLEERRREADGKAVDLN